jgi:hypothetical protein
LTEDYDEELAFGDILTTKTPDSVIDSADNKDDAREILPGECAYRRYALAS